jgi:hypothetical protein
MNPALALAAVCLVLGGATAGWQVRGLRSLTRRKLVPSDERAYLRGRYRRRLLNGVLLAVLGGLVAGAFLSGLEERADALAEPRPADANGDKPPMTPEQKALFRLWSLYWGGTVLLLMAVVGLAGLDLVANRRYWHGQMRRLREEHQTKLRRDLAVHRAQKEKTRGGISGQKLDGADG